MLMEDAGLVAHVDGPSRARVLSLGTWFLSRCGDDVDRADPDDSVPLRSRVLCAGLSTLALCVAPPGDGQDAIAVLAASLSLLTKIDDEVIDARAFHCGFDQDRRALREKTQRFLSVTLAALRRGDTDHDEPRARFAASIGRMMQREARSAHALEGLLALCEQGWATQVDAVDVLTRHPGEASRSEVERVTRRISGDWLALIAACGALPLGEPLASDEVEAIRDAGAFIQRADSLSDLEKDQHEGLTSTWAACELFAEGFESGIARELMRGADALGLEHRATPSAAYEGQIARRLAARGELAAWLTWIRGMLLERYRERSNTLSGGAACGAR